MVSRTLPAQQGTTVTIDLCDACQAFWFDSYESLQLTPGSTLQLFQVIAAAASASRRAPSPASPCPRCRARLVPVHDIARNTRFRYGRCPSGHGRFITFFDFLREKQFVRPLSPAQLAELRAQVQTVNCANCGAPVDLAHESACGHCGSPLSLFDLGQAETVVRELQDAGERRPSEVDRALLPLALARARQQAEAAFPLNEREGWAQEAATFGTVASGVIAFARWMATRV